MLLINRLRYRPSLQPFCEKLNEIIISNVSLCRDSKFVLFHDGAQLFHKMHLNLSRFLLEIQKMSAKLTVHKLSTALICDNYKLNETIISNVSLRTDRYVLFHNEVKLFCKTHLNPSAIDSDSISHILKTEHLLRFFFKLFVGKSIF